MTRMVDVAAAAGVSVTTVSHVVNGTRAVSAATEQLVREAMERVGYRPNRSVRDLPSASTATIGLAMGIVSNPYFATLAGELEERLRQAGYSLLLANTNDDPSVERDVLDDLIARQVSGMIAVPLEGSTTLTKVFQRIAEEEFPLVFLDRRSDLPVDQVYSEAKGPTFALAEHLASKGHHRIGYVNGTMRTTTAIDRLDGFQLAVRSLGLDDDPSLIIDGESDQHVSELAVLQHFAGSSPATALIVANNQMTIGTIRALQSLNKRVPDDVAVVSFDDFDGADLIQPGLTVLRQNTERLAAAAVRLLLRRLDQPNRGRETITVPPLFIHRGSCGCTT